MANVKKLFHLPVADVSVKDETVLVDDYDREPVDFEAYSLGL